MTPRVALLAVLLAASGLGCSWNDRLGPFPAEHVVIVPAEGPEPCRPPAWDLFDLDAWVEVDEQGFASGMSLRVWWLRDASVGCLDVEVLVIPPGRPLPAASFRVALSDFGIFDCYHDAFDLPLAEPGSLLIAVGRWDPPVEGGGPVLGAGGCLAFDDDVVAVSPPLRVELR